MTEKEKYRLLCNREKSIPLFSRDWWLDTVCGPDRWDVWLVEEKGRIVAAFPFYRPHPRFISMPLYTQTLGPWFAPDAPDTKYTTVLGRRQTLCRPFIDALQAYPYFLQNFHYSVTDWLPFYWAGYRQTTRYTYLLKNLRDPEELQKNMSANIRRNLQKAKEKHRISVRKGIPFDDFAQVYEQTFRRQHVRVAGDTRLLSRLATVARNRGQGDLWGAYDPEGRIHAAVFLVWQESSAYYLAGGGDPALRHSGAHSLVLYECIRHAAETSQLFDFEGSMLPGVERFFREFGAIQTPYFTIKRGNPSLLWKAWFKLTQRK